MATDICPPTPTARMALQEPGGFLLDKGSDYDGRRGSPCSRLPLRVKVS